MLNEGQKNSGIKPSSADFPTPEDSEAYIRGQYGYLFLMQKLFPSVRFISQAVRNDRKIAVFTRNENFYSKALLGPVTNDYIDRLCSDCTLDIDPEKHLLIERLKITSSKGSYDFNWLLQGTPIFTLVNSEVGERTMDTADLTTTSGDSLFKNDVAGIAYSSYARADYAHNIGVSPIPVDNVTLFIFGHELGHLLLPPKFYSDRVQKLNRQINESSTDISEYRDAIIRILGERSASAYAINYFRRVYQSLGIPVDKALRERLKSLYTSSLYTQYKPEFEAVGLVMPQDSPRLKRGYELYTEVEKMFL